MTYRIKISLADEGENNAPLAMSERASYHAAARYLDAILKHGKTEDEALAEVRQDMESSFEKAMIFFEQAIKENRG
jgi:translation initiation factor 2 alpha subunit (eIF-2alpha)